MHFVGSLYIMAIINARRLEHILISLFMMIFGSVNFLWCSEFNHKAHRDEKDQLIKHHEVYRRCSFYGVPA